MSGVAFTPTGVILGANVAIGTNANVSVDASRANDALAFPVGNSGQRPSGAPGMVRFNTDLNNWEGFISAWVPFGGSRITVQNNGVVVNTTSILDFSNGTNVLLTVTDDFANGRINIHLDSTGGGGGGGTINVEANASHAINSVANLNFNNTATVNVSVGGFQGNTTANIAFIANQSAIAGPAYAQANLAYDEANAAFTLANTAENDAANANNFATLAINNAAVANSVAQTAYNAANAASALANNSSNTANAAVALAILAANTVAVYANDTLVMANAFLDFNNTSTVMVNVAVNAVNQRANVTFTVDKYPSQLGYSGI